MNAKKKALALVLCALMLVAASVFGTLAYLTDKDTVENTFTVGHVDIKLDEAKVDAQGKPIKETTENGNVIRTEVVDYSTNEKDLLTANRVTSNSYHLVPGHTYTKDPTVTVIDGSEESYIRMMVYVEHIDDLERAIPNTVTNDDDTTTIINADYYTDYNHDQINDFVLEKLLNNTLNTEKWGFKSYSKTDTTGIYEFRYHAKVDTYNDVDNNGAKVQADKALEPLFTQIRIPGQLVDNEHITYLANVKIVVTAQAIQADGFEADDTNNKTAEDVAWEAFNNEVPAYAPTNP